jgi:hypothetical protein
MTKFAFTHEQAHTIEQRQNQQALGALTIAVFTELIRAKVIDGGRLKAHTRAYAEQIAEGEREVELPDAATLVVGGYFDALGDPSFVEDAHKTMREHVDRGLRAAFARIEELIDQAIAASGHD